MRMNEYDQPVGDPVAFTGARAPEPTILTGYWCSIAPLSPAHAEALFPQCAEPSRWTYLGWEPPDSVADLAGVIDGLIASDWRPWAILDPAGDPVGMCSYLRIDPGAGSIEVGGILYGDRLAHTTAATEAMYLLARHAFEELGYRRYEWKCDDLNAPSRAAAARLGFSYEGTFRQALTYKGRNRDTAWFAITDGQWPRLAAAFRQWLDPANFDDHGRQRLRLSDLATPGR